MPPGSWYLTRGEKRRCLYFLLRTSGLPLALPSEEFLYYPNLTYKILPLGVEVGLVGKATLHDVGAVAGAGLDRGHAATVRTVNQLHQGLSTIWTKRNLKRVDRTICITSWWIMKEGHSHPESPLMNCALWQFPPHFWHVVTLSSLYFRVQITQGKGWAAGGGMVTLYKTAWRRRKWQLCLSCVSYAVSFWVSTQVMKGVQLHSGVILPVQVVLQAWINGLHQCVCV